MARDFRGLKGLRRLVILGHWYGYRRLLPLAGRLSCNSIIESEASFNIQRYTDMYNRQEKSILLSKMLNSLDNDGLESSMVDYEGKV